MSKYSRKKNNPATAPEADEFVDFWTKAFESARPYARAIGWTLAGFLVVVGVGMAAMRYTERKAEAATEAWGRAFRIYENELEGSAPPVDDKKTDEEQIPRFKTAKERGEATLAELDKLPAGVRKDAQLFRAGVLYDLERYDESKKAYEDAIGGAPTEMAVIAREGVALCDEQSGKLDDAIAAYEKVAPKGDKATAFYRDHALMGLGRLYEKKGDKPKAIAAYKELADEMATSPLREDAQNRLAELGAS